MHTEKRLLALLVAAMVTLVALSTSPGQVSYAANNAMAVVAPGAADVGANFVVNINITAAGDPWAAWQAKVSWAGPVNFVPTDDVNTTVGGVDSWHYTGLGGTTLNAENTVNPNDVSGGTANASGTSTATGDVADLTFTCTAMGIATLHLVDIGSDPYGTEMLTPSGADIPTDLGPDIAVNCGGEAPAPTPTPGEVPTATATPGGPAPTPSVPGATPTPLPPGFEAIDLAAGCNPVATTYADATPIGTIAGAVGPAGNLDALWEVEGGNWLGYSPAYPEASDLTAKNFLDVVFVCVTGPGAFVRPIV